MISVGVKRSAEKLWSRPRPVTKYMDALVSLEEKPPIGFVTLDTTASFADARAAIVAAGLLLPQSAWGFVVVVAGRSVTLTEAQESFRTVDAGSQLTVRRDAWNSSCAGSDLVAVNVKRADVAAAVPVMITTAMTKAKARAAVAAAVAKAQSAVASAQTAGEWLAAAGRVNSMLDVAKQALAAAEGAGEAADMPETVVVDVVGRTL